MPEPMLAVFAVLLDSSAVAIIAATMSAGLVKLYDRIMSYRRKKVQTTEELLDIAEREAALGRRMQEWMDRIEEDLLNCQEQHRQCQEETQKLREEHAREVASLRIELSVLKAQVRGLSNSTEVSHGS